MYKEYQTFSVQQLVEGFIYTSLASSSVYGLNGKLVVQPAYQRNYIYDALARDEAVIESILRLWPIGTLYFYQVDDDTQTAMNGQKYELLDGQQRLVSIGRFIQGSFAIDVNDVAMYFNNLPESQRNLILDYQVPVCICSGRKEEVMDWFRVLNTVGIPLTDQEILNAVYAGPFVSELRKSFSDASNPKVRELYSKFITGDPKRQELLNTILKWHTRYLRWNAEGNGEVEEYLAFHQMDADYCKTGTQVYIDSVFDWAMRVFRHYDPLMRGIDWGLLHCKFRNNAYEPVHMYQRMHELIDDTSVTKRKGIFEYLLDGEQDPRLLDIRVFDRNTKLMAYASQTRQAQEDHVSNCPLCAQSDDEVRNTRIYDFLDMEADHITAWKNGGRTTADNCQMLCKTCNRTKSYS